MPDTIAKALRVQLGSQLRLQLMAELLEEPAGLTLEAAAVRVASPQGDIAACLKPLVAAGVVEAQDDERHWRLSPGIRPQLLAVVRQAVQQGARHLRRERRVRNELLRGMIGGDPKMQLVTEMVRKVARLDVPILITGETGTGKELVARAVHELSGRASGPFEEVNCATLTESLFESHVFGHARGAFTGAVRANPGLIEKVDGGTLFLDEVGELSLENQARLLRVLQSHTFTRVGETALRSSNFRVVSATNRHLPQMVASGGFREDLYYRINVFPIALPALRERLDDLPYLVEELAFRSPGFQSRAPGMPVLTSAALGRLRAHGWPGNIRELENVVTRGLIASNGEPIDVEHLPLLDPNATEVTTPSAPAAALKSLAEVEREHVALVLTASAGNIGRAAATLGISRATLYRTMRRYQLEVVRVLRR